MLQCWELTSEEYYLDWCWLLEWYIQDLDGLHTWGPAEWDDGRVEAMQWLRTELVGLDPDEIIGRVATSISSVSWGRLKSCYYTGSSR
jgi:hypothetical protein